MGTLEYLHSVRRAFYPDIELPEQATTEPIVEEVEERVDWSTNLDTLGAWVAHYALEDNERIFPGLE